MDKESGLPLLLSVYCRTHFFGLSLLQCSETAARFLFSGNFLRFGHGIMLVRRHCLLLWHIVKRCCLFWTFWSDNKFALLYHDEAKITVNVSHACAWVKSGASHEGEIWFRLQYFFFFFAEAFGAGMEVFAFLDSTAMDILQRPEGSRRFEDGEISGAIVRRQQTKRALDFDEDSDEDEEERQKKKSESFLDAPKDTADKVYRSHQNRNCRRKVEASREDHCGRGGRWWAAHGGAFDNASLYGYEC